jgi:hypothetical protein
MKYTQLKLKPEYREKLGTLAARHNRSLTNMLEWLIDNALCIETCKACDGSGKYRAERCFGCSGIGNVVARLPQ